MTMAMVFRVLGTGFQDKVLVGKSSLIGHANVIGQQRFDIAKQPLETNHASLITLLDGNHTRQGSEQLRQIKLFEIKMSIVVPTALRGIHFAPVIYDIYFWGISRVYPPLAYVYTLIFPFATTIKVSTIEKERKGKASHRENLQIGSS
jgi:hypothetical protein